MARQQRTTAFAQESTRPITQVALYARVSTLNNQDPEMQLAELREYGCARVSTVVNRLHQRPRGLTRPESMSAMATSQRPDLTTPPDASPFQ
jgi:predicted site-specific integrase-resolvase